MPVKCCFVFSITALNISVFLHLYLLPLKRRSQTQNYRHFLEESDSFKDLITPEIWKVFSAYLSKYDNSELQVCLLNSLGNISLCNITIPLFQNNLI